MSMRWSMRRSSAATGPRSPTGWTKNRRVNDVARARNIKPGFFSNDELAEVSPLGRLLFIALWTMADRAGRLEDRPKRIKVEALPYDDCDAESLLSELAERDFILRYARGDRRYIQIV